MAIRFLLNGDPVEITDLPGTTTLLNWLRYERGLTGTKEGCAEGDCGACTVALRTAAHEGLDIKPVCACIQTLGMVHGREVITVEGISAQDGRLHPVQQALADGHGSQCGFCTPGFVMSLWSSYQSGKRPDRAQTCDALAGNLCRCTGYGPIINAASTAFDLPSPDWQDADATAHARLQNLNAGALIHEAMGRKFWAPETLSELAGLVADHPEATILSGATDIGLWITKHNFDPAEVIYTGRVAEFAAISLSENHLTIGAGATYRDAMVVLSRRSPTLAALITRIGGGQVRAMGTIGGNIANGSPIGDMPPALIAMGALLILRHRDIRREIALEDFFIAYGRQDLRPGEFVEAIRVPLPSGPDTLRCYKQSKRRDQDITAVLGCFRIELIDGKVLDARLAFGGMAGTPARARAAERELIGQPWTTQTIGNAQDALGHDFNPMSDHRGSADYRMKTARNLLTRYFHDLHANAKTDIWELA